MKHSKVFRDANHKPIVDELRKMGYSVIDLAPVGSNIPDIIIADSNTTALNELKMPDGRFYLGQLEFLARWPGIAGFAETVDDCVNLMTDPEKYRLSNEAKEAILAIVADLRADEFRDQKQPRIAVKKFEKLLAERLAKS